MTTKPLTLLAIVAFFLLVFAWGVGLRGQGREGERISAMVGIGSMRVREEKRMVRIGLCERGKERLREDGIVWV